MKSKAIKLYGIKNCDTVKKARRWLDQHGLEYQFHDVRLDGLDASQINSWRKQIDWETLVNKRSTTWKQLDDATKTKINADTVNDVLLAHPTLIKRPVLECSGQVHVGFKDSDYATFFD